MLLQDLTKKLEAIKKQQENLKQQEKELSNQAVKERVLEVDIYQLIKEIQKITKSTHAEIHYSHVYAPAHCANNIEYAKIWLRNRNPKVHITISLDNKYIYTITQNFADIKLNNGELASDNIFIRYITVGILNEFRDKIMLNISPLDKQLKNEIFKEAVYNCVAKKETENLL